jgi:uncharacterized protein YgiM (DUF1202 family)
VNTGVVYVRAWPSRHENVNRPPVIGNLKQGRTFKIRAFVNNKGTNNDWYKLTYKGRTAYVFAGYVEVVWK